MLCFENHLRKSIREKEYSYTIPYFAILALSYFFFYICGKNPGYATDTEQVLARAREIELEAPIVHVLNPDLSLEIRDEIANERRSSLLSSHTDISDEYLSLGVENEEEKVNFSIIRGERRNRHIMSPPSRDSSPHKIPERRFCKVCNILQPYRTKHCHLCERCIHKFDHHCVWVGNLHKMFEILSIYKEDVSESLTKENFGHFCFFRLSCKFGLML